MLEKIINNPELLHYMVSFEPGQIVFTEGDESEDLFILVSGELEILKGNKKISEISRPGELFGEMSVLLGGKRTATVKVITAVKALKIVKEDIARFLDSSPEITRDVTFMLARRLDETSQILYGLKEFCDQLPDAVTITNKEGKILTWNSVAEKMYGRTWEGMHYKPIEEIYEEPGEYINYRDDLISRYSVREKILRINHPEKGTRYIATSTTVLYDGHHNCQGFLSIGRDVTRFRDMEQHYHHVRKKIIPLLIVLLILLPGVFFSYKFINNRPAINVSASKDFRNQLGKDFILLKSLLADHFTAKERLNTHSLMKEFISIQDISDIPYKGIILLDKDLNVFDYLNINGDDTDESQIIGSSYSGIEFKGSNNSLYRVLTVYRADKSHPMGEKGIEVAFEFEHDNKAEGWIIFQLDPVELEKKYGLNEDDLIKFRFEQK
jgi:PAS domain S-box-containing protein